MPRKRFPTSLADVVAAWIEQHCCHGPGDVYGETVRLTDEEFAFLEQAYAIDQHTGRRLNDIAVYSRRKGTRKSELGAWLCHVEAIGPCRAVLDDDGDPAVTSVMDPWVLCAATTEDQSDLVYGAFRAIAKASPTLESLYDVGLEVTYPKDRPGKVELTQTGNAAALDGARPTFEVADEPHLWVGNLHESFATLRRNLRKRKASQPWLFAPTTAYQPGQDSEAERLHAAAGKGAPRLVFNHRQAVDSWDLDDDEQLRSAILEAGGDAYWSDIDAIVAEYAASYPDTPQFRRYWLNQPRATEAQWCPPEVYDSHTLADELVDDEWVSLGFDGSLYDDATVLWASRMSDGWLTPVGIWERPDKAPRSWAMPKTEVDQVVRHTMQRLRVVRFYCDPHYWQSEIESWADAAPRGASVLTWDTRRTAATSAMLERLQTDLVNGKVTIAPDPAGRQHFLNATVDDRGGGKTVVVKPAPRLKVDSVYGAGLAHEARADALAAGWKPRSGVRFASF